MAEFITFFAGAAIILVGALGVVASRNPVHSALFLVQTLMGVAVIFVLQDAHFLAAVQVVVYAGATARPETVQSIQPWLGDLREQLVADGVLTHAAGELTLSQDYTFGSPSTAASVLLGRHANGRVEWRAEDGRTLKEIQEASLDAGIDPRV